jgi:hypothetical protein
LKDPSEGCIVVETVEQVRPRGRKATLQLTSDHGIYQGG